jgi:unsaturated rhamnogalacturonyl hydrolase
VKKVADWQYGRIKNSPSQDWTFAPLYDGFLAAADAFGEPKYRELVNGVGEHFHWTLGTESCGQTQMNRHWATPT